MKPKEVPKIVVDIHEKESGLFEDIYARNIGDCTEEYLLSGDVAISYGDKTVGIEMKREHDLDNSLRDNRLKNQIINMNIVYNVSFLIIQEWHPHVTEFDNEYTLANKVRIHDKTVKTLNRRVITYETLTQSESIEVIEDIIKDMISGKLFHMTRKPVDIGADNPQIDLISRLPNVGIERATLILEAYGTPLNALNNVNKWDIPGITADRIDVIKSILGLA
jgi:DNA excision repair protein ERCC-4